MISSAMPSQKYSWWGSADKLTKGSTATDGRSSAAVAVRLAAGAFDAVLIDCPPSLGPLTRSALAASSAVIVPIQCEYYPLEGLVQLLATVRHSARLNPGLAVGGVLLTMYDPAAQLSRDVEAEVRAKLAEPVFTTVIPRDPAVAEAPSHCRSVIDYAPRSPGARAYVRLALEVLKHSLLEPKP